MDPLGEAEDPGKAAASPEALKLTMAWNKLDYLLAMSLAPEAPASRPMDASGPLSQTPHAGAPPQLILNLTEPRGQGT